jgi:hypothetical protein
VYDDSSDRGGSRSSGNNGGIRSDLRKKVGFPKSTTGLFAQG